MKDEIDMAARRQAANELRTQYCRHRRRMRARFWIKEWPHGDWLLDGPADADGPENGSDRAGPNLPPQVFNYGVRQTDSAHVAIVGTTPLPSRLKPTTRPS